MPTPYDRTSTPDISYVGTVAEKDCFRLHLNGHESLNALLFRGEVAEVLLKSGVEHRIGNSFREVSHLDNPKKKDFFVLLDRADVRKLTDKFEVLGYNPGLVS